MHILSLRFIIDVKEIGRRLKLIRQKLRLSQTEVAKEINGSQLTVSKIERGENVLSSSFLAILLFYSESVNIDLLLNKKFDPADDDLMNKNFSAKSIIREKLLMMQKDLNEKINSMQSSCNEQITNSIDML